MMISENLLRVRGLALVFTALGGVALASPLFLALVLVAINSLQAQAAVVFGADVSDYVALYEGTGGHNLSITNVTIGGPIGVGGKGVVQFSGPGTIQGRLDFSAANSGQFHNTNGSNVGPTSVDYGVATVSTLLGNLDTLNGSTWTGTATNLDINGTQTINESDGLLTTFNGVTSRVFNVTSYTEKDGKLVTINGDGSGDPVVFNFGFASNVNLGGDVALNGLSGDQVLWNFTSSGKNIQLNNNASSYPSLAFQGVILAPNDQISVTNANLVGRVFGGDSADMQIVSGTHITAPVPAVPEPSSLVFALFGSVSLVLLAIRRRSRAR